LPQATTNCHGAIEPTCASDKGDESAITRGQPPSRRGAGREEALMRSALQRLRIAAAVNDIELRDEGTSVVLVSRGHPHGLGVAVEVRGNIYVRLPDELDEPELDTADVDVVVEWVFCV
jgi:hypothetical protein